MSEFDTFQQAVITAYLEKKEKHELPSALENPTPAKLKRYSLQIVAQRYSKEDAADLELFFGPKKDDEHIENSIRKFEIDKFRPLINYLKGGTSKTDEKNPKILAWLIDFHPRPYERWRKARQGIEMGLTTELDEQDGPISPESLTVPAELPRLIAENSGSGKTSGVRTASPKIHKGVWYGILGIAASIAVYLLLTMLPAHECMYWNEDRYAAADCQEKISGANMIARDENLLKHFRKIMRPDTLTSDHVNKVWYSKIDNVVEFFTLPGFHPIHQDRSLKAATAHIIEQYAGKNDQQ